MANIEKININDIKYNSINSDFNKNNITIDEFDFENYGNIGNNSKRGGITFKNVERIQNILENGGSIDFSSLTPEELFYIRRQFTIGENYLEQICKISSNGDIVNVLLENGIELFLEKEENGIYSTFECNDSTNTDSNIANLINGDGNVNLFIKDISDADKKYLNKLYNINNDYIENIKQISTEKNISDTKVTFTLNDGTSITYYKKNNVFPLNCNLEEIVKDGTSIPIFLIREACVISGIDVEKYYNDELEIINKISIENNNICFNLDGNKLIYDNFYNLVDILNENNESIIETLEIYDESKGYFGGNQHTISNIRTLYYDKNIREIISNYFPDEDLSPEDYELLFNRMTCVGCGYIAQCNAIFNATMDMSDETFEDTFGFPRYNITKVDGKYTKVFNYDYMFMDMFLNHWKNNKGLNSIKEIYGNQSEVNAAEDMSRNPYEVEFIGSKGLGDPDKCFNSYLSSKFSEEEVEYLKHKGLGFSSETNYTWDIETLGDYAKYKYSISNYNIEKELAEGKQVIFNMDNFTLYYPDDRDGNGKLDDIAMENVGAHSVIVTKSLGDGLYEISSWGEKYIVKPEMHLEKIKGTIIQHDIESNIFGVEVINSNMNGIDQVLADYKSGVPIEAEIKTTTIGDTIIGAFTSNPIVEKVVSSIKESPAATTSPGPYKDAGLLKNINIEDLTKDDKISEIVEDFKEKTNIPDIPIETISQSDPLTEKIGKIKDKQPNIISSKKDGKEKLMDDLNEFLNNLTEK